MGRGKEAAPPAPAFKPSEVKYGDTVVSKTYLDPVTGSIVNQYIPDPAEEARKQAAQLKLNEVMSTVGLTAPELATRMDKTEQAFVADAQKKFQESYDPALRSLREDITARFGTLNTSQFISGLNDLEKNRANALSDIVNKGQMLKQDLVNNDETRKLNEIQALGGILSDSQSALLNTSKASLTAADALNDFLNGQWVQQLKAYTSAQNSKRQMLASSAKTMASSSGS